MNTNLLLRHAFLAAVFNRSDRIKQRSRSRIVAVGRKPSGYTAPDGLRRSAKMATYLWTVTWAAMICFGFAFPIGGCSRSASEGDSAVTPDATAKPKVALIMKSLANEFFSTMADDAGSLAVLHALADKGEAEILAVVTNRRGKSTASAAACDVINTFYGRPDIPIGTDKDGAKFGWNRVSPYTPALRDGFPHDAKVDDEMPDALPPYRKTLAAAADKTVVICSVGAPSNLEDLINSGGDDFSSLNGTELIQQ
jgi:hypothetical protein